jgi:death-on-curing protein
MVDAIHQAQLREHGGSPGVRDDGLIESALARPRNRMAYARQPDLATLAAAYAFGLARNHGYVDGNKRVAFMGAYVFLGLNGCEVVAEEAEVVVMIEGLAAARVTERALANWFRANSGRSKGDG